MLNENNIVTNLSILSKFEEYIKTPILNKIIQVLLINGG